MRINKYINLKFYQSIKSILGIKPNWYYIDLKELIYQREKSNNHDFDKLIIHPQLKDKFDSAGIVNGHYFHQDYYVAKEIYIQNPKKHVDVGSRIDGFVAHVAVFRKIEILDIRNLESEISNILFKQKDLLSNEVELDYCDSISSLHAVEHFGLGRYGDKIDFFGHVKAVDNIAKMLKSDGIFYFSVPIGDQRIEFNAHRVFSMIYLLDLLKKDFDLLKFSYVNDNGCFIENVILEDTNIKSNFNCFHGCGIFILKKKRKS